MKSTKRVTDILGSWGGQGSGILLLYILATSLTCPVSCFVCNPTASLVNTAPQRSMCRPNICSIRAGLVPPPPPPRRSEAPPPPPPFRPDATTAPARQAGDWRDKIVAERKNRARSEPDTPVIRVAKAKFTADMERNEQERKNSIARKKAGPPPPPMMTSKEWEVCLRIPGALDGRELAWQLECAKEGDMTSLEIKWLKDGASRAEITKRLSIAMLVRQEARSFPPGTRPWGEGRKSARPPKAEFYRYMWKDKKFGGKVLPMSAPRKNSISEEQFMPQKLVTIPLLNAAKAATRALPAAPSRGQGGGRGRGGRGRGGGGAGRRP